MLYIIYGQDSYSSHQELDNIKKGLGDTDMLAVNTCLLEGKDISPDQLRDICNTVPFLNPYRLVIVEGLLDSFEPETKQKSRLQTTEKGKDSRLEKWQFLASFTNEMPQSTVLVFVDGKITMKNSLLKVLNPLAKVKNFTALKDSNLSNWIQERVKNNGSFINSTATKLLIGYCGSDLWVLGNEIDKLLAYCSGRTITEDDVKQITCYSRESNIFNLVDAIFEKKIEEAQKILHRIIKEGANPPYIIGMITRQLRLIVKAKSISTRMAKTEALEKLNLSSEYVLNKTLNQAKKYTYEQLKQVYHRILQTDIDIKTGKYDEDLAIDLLVTELCRY